MSLPDHVSEERRRRPLVVAVTALAAILPLAGTLLQQSAYRNLGDSAPALLIDIDSKSSTLLISSILTGIGAALLSYTLFYLYQATRARRPQTPAAARAAAVFGGIVTGVAGVALQVLLDAGAHNFVADGGLSYDQARRVTGSDELLVVQALGFAARLALAFAIVMIALNAMRAGLLTRFMGYVGIFVGVFLILPILGGTNVVIQSFWLVALTFLLAGRWPNGVPPAWEDGEAHPWASIAQQRDAAARAHDQGASPSEAARARPKPTKPDPEPDEKPAAVPGRVQVPADPGAARRKRKKRK